jgi:hypothetical protein
MEDIRLVKYFIVDTKIIGIDDCILQIYFFIAT